MSDVIINLTQHAATSDQREAGVIDATRQSISDLLTFDTPPTMPELERRAQILTGIAKASGATAAMIGGAPFFMAALEWHLSVAGIKPLYAFSERTSEEEIQSDGSIKKTQIFRHKGFVNAAPWRHVIDYCDRHCDSSPWNRKFTRFL